MIKLNGVTKGYISKSKQRVDALKGVNFELPNKGMVFILGKSGSGKSTLLNLLGGLDSPSNGEIIVDGVSMKDFTPTDYEGYRNDYVGFIFQEYNLLDEFNVRDNIALALQLSKETNIDEKVKTALREVELTDDYALRRVGEMSGGEKQRIAIARCIVKESKMILADEPTGNLDSATGESIWNILKKLSQNRLVVVVSHDRESAEKYGDRIIEIADGLVKSDSGTTQSDGDVSVNIGKDFTNVKKGLPMRACLKMSVNNLAQRKVKTVSVILLAIFTILTLLLTEMFIAFSPEKTIADFVKKYDVPYFTVQQRKRDDDGLLNKQHILRNDTRKYLDKNCEYILNGVVEGKDQILDFGFTFLGEAQELTSNSYYVTSDAVEYSYQFGKDFFIDDNGDKVELVKEKHPIESLVGKRVFIFALNMIDTNVPVLAGVIDSDVINEKSRAYIPSKFVRSDFENRSDRYSLLMLNQDTSNAVMAFGNGSYEDVIQISDEFPNRGLKVAMLTSDGLKSVDKMSKMTLADDEIVLTYEMYAQLCEAKSKWYYVNSDLSKVNDGIEMPIEFGHKLPLKFYDSVTGDIIADLGEFKLAGIVFAIFNDGSPTSFKYEMAVSKKIYDKLYDLLDVSKTILIKSDSVANLTRFISALNVKYDTQIIKAGEVKFTDRVLGSDIVAESYGMIESMRASLFIMIAICVIMVVVLILLVINLISFSITNRKREIGILSALGTSNKDITKIFLFETLVIAAISFVITLILTFVMAVVFNALICSTHHYELFISVFRVDILTIAVLAVSSFGLLLLAAWIPTSKIAKLKPIDAIRNT